MFFLKPTWQRWEYQQQPLHHGCAQTMPTMKQAVYRKRVAKKEFAGT